MKYIKTPQELSEALQTSKATTIRKIISEIDKTKEFEPSWEELADIFNVNDLYWSDDTRLKCYFIKKWYCTDSYVGTRVYFLDDEFVAISNQMGRKMNEDFSFVSEKLANKLKIYLESLVENKFNLSIIEDNFLDKEIPSTFKIEYNSQILHKEAFLNGEKVKIVKTNYSWKDKAVGEKADRYFHTVEILKDGKKEEIDCRELDFEYNT